jgi:AraC family transcriptional regulator, regulatory protein of adaptative response / DNA-3-methyladenine glycosylase II
VTFLPASGPFDPDSTFGYLARHAIPAVEVADPASRTLTRLMPRLGQAVPVRVRLTSDGVELQLLESGAEPAAELIPLVRAWFDLDADLAAIGAALDRDPLLAATGQAFPAVRIVGFPDGFEAAMTTVLGQQVSLAAMRTFAGRLAAGSGSAGPAGLTIFPTPARLAAVPVDELRASVGVTSARARTLHEVAALFAEGFNLDGSIPSTAARARLLALPGIGPWTVEYLAMRVLHDADACPAGDLVLRRAVGASRTADVLRRAEAWRPYRAYGVMRVWTNALAAAR